MMLNCWILCQESTWNCEMSAVGSRQNSVKQRLNTCRKAFAFHAEKGGNTAVGKRKRKAIEQDDEEHEEQSILQVLVSNSSSVIWSKMTRYSKSNAVNCIGKIFAIWTVPVEETFRYYQAIGSHIQCSIQARGSWKSTLEEFMKAPMSPVVKGHTYFILRMLEAASGKHSKGQVNYLLEHLNSFGKYSSMRLIMKHLR